MKPVVKETSVAAITMISVEPTVRHTSTIHLLHVVCSTQKKTGGSGTYKKIRLSSDADSSDVVNIVQAGASANGNSYTGHIYYETLINGVWETLFSMSHNEPNNPRMLRYVFNGEYWVDAEATEQSITPE